MKPEIEIFPMGHAISGYQLVVCKRGDEVIVDLGVPGKYIRLTHDNRVLTFNDSYPTPASLIASCLKAWAESKALREPNRKQEFLSLCDKQIEDLGSPAPQVDTESEHPSVRFAQLCRAIETHIRTMQSAV